MGGEKQNEEGFPKYLPLEEGNCIYLPPFSTSEKTRVRKYGEKEMRIRLNFLPRGTKPEEIFSCCVDSGLGEPNRMERCKFEGIEGEAVDIRLVPHPDVDWQMEQMDFDRKATFCGKICDITFNCLDLKAFCKRCKEFGHLPSRCPSKEAEPKPMKDDHQLVDKRTSDEISPLQQSNQAKRNRVLKATMRKSHSRHQSDIEISHAESTAPVSAVEDAQPVPSPEKKRQNSSGDSPSHHADLSFTMPTEELVENSPRYIKSDTKRETEWQACCIKTPAGGTLKRMLRMLGTPNIPCAECDYVYTPQLRSNPDELYKIPGHRVCSVDSCLRLVCEDHLDCVAAPYQSDSE